MQPGSKLVLRIALVTGQRIGEICGAEKSEFDLDRAEWRIPAKRVKNRREHSVPLSPLAVSLYRERLRSREDHILSFQAGPGLDLGSNHWPLTV